MPRTSETGASRPHRQTVTGRGRVLSRDDVAQLSVSGEGPSVAELPSIHERAREHGYREGVRRAMAELHAAMLELREYRSDTNAWIQRFVFAIVRRIIAGADSATVVTGLVEQALRECDRSIGSVVVHVHPDSAESVAARVAELSHGGLVVDVIPDERLAESDCEIRTPLGILDAGLHVQLDALERALSPSPPDARAR